ncbi:MAG: ATP-binding protein [bacterium]
MLNRESIKEIILSNEDFILNEIRIIVPRDGVVLPRELRKVAIIHGIRRCGKSFVLFDIFKKNRDIALYIDFEDERLAGVTSRDLSKIKESFFELKPHLLRRRNVVFLFDEIQSVPDWEKFCRRLCEKDSIRVFVAGSSSKITPRHIHTSLRGRAWGIELFPFSFREFLKAQNLVIEKTIYTKDKVKIKNSFAEYFEWGGFPEVILLKSDFARRKVLKEYFDAMFFKDLLDKYRITNIHLIDTLRENLFSTFGRKFSLTSFYRKYHTQFPFSKDTLATYYRYFLDSMLIYETRLFASSAYRRMRNPPVIYVADIGLAKRVKSSDRGHLLENHVFLELKRRGSELYYRNEKTECDFIVKSDDGVEVMQVTYELNDENQDREIDGLVDACKTLKKRQGTIVTMDQEDEFKVRKTNIRIVPFWKWAIQ